jgi:Flp pilus assembly protein TadG
MPQWKRLTALLRADDGSAALEFITAGMLLLVPLVYLALAVASIQGAALAVEGAARQAARVYVQAPSAEEARDRASRAVEFALADYGLNAADADVTVNCVPDPGVCLVRNGAVTVTVRVGAALPLVPSVLDLQRVASVPMQATATQKVSRFWSGE